MPLPRSAGILLHPTSLPGRFGIGEIGPEAHRWLAHLNSMSQRLWQVLPLGPTGYGDSPYQTLSTFAGNTMLISFDSLRNEGLLREEDLKDFPLFPEDRVDYGPVLLARSKILDKVAKSFARRASPALKAGWMQFCEKERDWLNDYTLFCALKKEYGGGPWVQWPETLRQRQASAISSAQKKYSSEMKYSTILQFLFSTSGTFCAKRPRSVASL